MLSGHRSARRRRGNKSRAARIAVPLAIPMALGLTLGIIIAVSGGNTTTIAQSALGSCASAAASAPARRPAPRRQRPGRERQCPGRCGQRSGGSELGRGGTLPVGIRLSGRHQPCATAADFAIPPNNAANRAGLAGANAVDAAGNAFSFTQNADQAAASMNCTVSVPANPLTAQGLASPWVLGDGCTWANGGTEGVFIDATILAPNGQIQVYNPLVINQGTTPAVAPTPPTIAAGSQVILSARVQRQRAGAGGRGRAAGQLHRRVRQLADQPDAAVQRGQLLPAGQRRDRPRHADGPGRPAPARTARPARPRVTSRLIDQDQSDNAVASYLFDPATGQSAQATAANAGGHGQRHGRANGSDNGLLDKFVDPALGCTPFTAPNPTNPNGSSASQALNELSARANQKGTIALLPVNDPQLLVGGQFSIGKTNAYRVETDQPRLAATTNTSRNAARYCQNMVNIQTPRLKLDAAMETGTASPVPALGNNLANFLAARLSGSFGNLNCQNFGLTNPVTLTIDAQRRGDRRDVQHRAADRQGHRHHAGAPAPAAAAAARATAATS